MEHHITRYLNDHLAGSSGALLFIEGVAESHDVPEAQTSFHQLKEKVKADRLVLEDLLERIGRETESVLQKK